MSIACHQQLPTEKSTKTLLWCYFDKNGEHTSIISLSTLVKICILLNFSFSSRSLSKEYTFLILISKVDDIFLISLSLYKTGELKFIFLLLLSKLEKLFLNFSFSSRLDFFASRQSLPLADCDKCKDRAIIRIEIA